MSDDLRHVDINVDSHNETKEPKLPSREESATLPWKGTMDSEHESEGPDHVARLNTASLTPRIANETKTRGNN